MDQDSSKKCIIVDDDEQFRHLLQTYFDKRTVNLPLDLSLIIERDGLRAWDYISKHAAEVVLLHTDIIHSGIDGIELTRRIKKKYPHIKVVVCTGALDICRECHELADLVIEKPIDMQTYFESVRELIG